MEIQFPKSFDRLFFERLLYEESIQKIIRVVRIILGILVVLLLGIAASEMFSAFLATPAAVNDLDAQVTQILSGSGEPLQNEGEKRSYDLLEKTKMFGKFGEEETPKPTPSSKEEKTPITTLPLELIGTFVSDTARSYAIIENKKSSSQEIFTIGETVFEEAKLTRISNNQVEILRNGQKEILVIDETAAEGGATTAGADEVFELDEGELNQALDNLPLLLTQARAVPYFKDGKAIGLRLFAIKTGSLYEKIGLKNGDILKTINGKNLGDISEAMKLFENLRKERSLTLVLERNRKESTFAYSIR